MSLSPTAYIIIHPTKTSVMDAMLFALSQETKVDTSIAIRCLQELKGFSLDGGEFAATYAALWSAITSEPSWSSRSRLDEHEGLGRLVIDGMVWLEESLTARRNILIMASPRMVATLREHSYNIIFLDQDASTMSKAEALVSFPRSYDGVCGEWLKYSAQLRSKLGKVIPAGSPTVCPTRHWTPIPVNVKVAASTLGAALLASGVSPT